MNLVPVNFFTTASTEALLFPQGDFVKNFICWHWDIPADAAFLSEKLDKGETLIGKLGIKTNRP